MFKPWFERKFDLDLPDWMYPNVLERLRGTPARCQDVVQETSPEMLTARSGEAWSIQENIGHLLDLEPLWLESAGPEVRTRTALHPRLEQPMRLLDLMQFVAEHDDHHLAQVARLKRKLSA